LQGLSEPRRVSVPIPREIIGRRISHRVARCFDAPDEGRIFRDSLGDVFQFVDDTGQSRPRQEPFLARPELKGQVLLGSGAFVAKMRPLLEGKGALTKISRAQRLAHQPGLKSLLSARVRQDKPARDAAMRWVCLKYGYTMAAVAREASIHDSTVSKVIYGKLIKAADIKPSAGG
jgi:hypothetical protein